MQRKILLVRPKRQRSGDGYGEFGPDGDRLAEYWRRRGAQVRIVEVDLHVVELAPLLHAAEDPSHLVDFRRVMNERMRRTVAAITAAVHSPLHFDTLIIACHGWRTALQIGLRNTRASCRAFVDVLAAAGMELDVDVFLAACSAGTGSVRGDRSVADELRDALSAAGYVNASVYAHTADGRAFANPYVRVFRGDGTTCPLEGGAYLVSPKHTRFPAWKRAMRSDEGQDGPLRYRFFDMSSPALLAEIERRASR